MRSSDDGGERVEVTGGDRAGYALLDAGDGRRLERFGQLVLDRPAPVATAPRRAAARWAAAHLQFETRTGWTGRMSPTEPWTIEIAGLRMELRATSSGGVGLYPEHAVNLPWLEAEIHAGLAAGHPPAVLNLFAHTGLATLAAARAGAAVAHVDAARTSVAWARRNAELSGLAGNPVRWLVDDAAAFVEREARRARRYDGLILDPPSTGHGRAGRWTLRDDLPPLIEACAAVTSDGAFVLLTAHSTGLDGEDLRALLVGAFPRRQHDAEVVALVLRAASGASLDLGWAVRLRGRNAAP